MSDYIVIENENASVVVDRLGAQIVSYKIKDLEIMYQGALDPENSAWKATAKNLFPNPGPLGNTDENGKQLETVEIEVNGKKQKYTRFVHNGGYYYMGQHGFIQNTVFDVQSKRPDYCVLSTTDNENTTWQYPYKFKYTNIVSLTPEGYMEYVASATNMDNKPMLAGLGWHPAFALHKDSSRYKLVLTNVVGDLQYEEKQVIDGKTVKVKHPLAEGEEFDIFGKVIEPKASLTISGIKEADVKLVYYPENGKPITYLTMHTSSPNLVLWSKEGNMVAIEPWNTKSRQMNRLTTQDKTASLKGASIIEPNKSHELCATVGINPDYVKEIMRDKSSEKNMA